MERPARTWAETLRESPAKQQALVPYKIQTNHTVGKNLGFIYPFATQSHLLLTGRYSGRDDKKRDSIPTCLSVGTGSNEGTTATSPYGGTCRHQEKPIHELALHGRTRRHCHGCHTKIGSWRMDHHMGHSGPLLKH